MSHHTSARKREAERRYPHRVDVPVPPGGLGNRINLMNDWCRANFHADQWAHYGHSQKEAGQIAEDYARFYFLSKADADLFRWKWMKLD
jgi:hypothetical protein